MKRMTGMLVAATAAVGLVAGSAGMAAASYHAKPAYNAPAKKAYKQPAYNSGYSGNYPPAYCFSGPTYNPPGYYLQNCQPPQAWINWCSGKYRSFQPHNGYYKNYDGYWHFCGH